MSLVKGNIDIKSLCEKIGEDTSKALLSPHALTGSETTGKFEGKSKQFWFRQFLAIDQTMQFQKRSLLIFKNQMNLQKKLRVLFAGATYTDRTKKLKEKYVKRCAQCYKIFFVYKEAA